MIDSIKVGVPLTQSQLTKLNKITEAGENWQWVQLQRSSGELRFCRIRGLAHLDKNSFHREVYWDIPQSFIKGECFLTVELSLPKFWYGHNIHLLHNFVDALDCLKQLLEKQLHCKFPKVLEWQVWRVDVCYAWRCPSQPIAQQLLDSLKHLTFPYKKPVIYPTSIVFAGTTYSVKFYLKHPEFRHHDRKALLKSKASLEWIEHLENQSLGVLRYEATLRRRFLKTKDIKTIADLMQLLRFADWNEEFKELNPDFKGDAESISTAISVIMLYKMDAPPESELFEQQTELIDGCLYEAPPTSIDICGELVHHNGGGFYYRTVSKPTDMLQYFLNKYLGENKGMNLADEVKLKLQAKYKKDKAFRLYSIWVIVQKDGIQSVKESLGKAVFYKAKAALKAADISFVQPPRLTLVDDEFIRNFKFKVPSSYVTNSVDDFRDSDNLLNLKVEKEPKELP